MSYHATTEIVGLVLMLVVLVTLGVHACRSTNKWSERVKVVSVVSPMLMFCVCSIAWLVGGAIAIGHGGYTWNGKIENGVHFVRYKSRYTAVTEETWHYLQWIEGWTGGWTLVAGIFSMAILLLAACVYKRSVSSFANRKS